MRWFKHMTASRDDEKLSSLTDMCGLEGYGFWWALLEIVARSIENGKEPTVTYSVAKWCALLGIHHHKFRKLLKAGEDCGLYEVFTPDLPQRYPNATPTLPSTYPASNSRVAAKYAASNFTVKINNLLKYRDEYTRKSGQNPEQLPSKEQIQNIDTEADTEEKKNTKKSSRSPKTPLPEKVKFGQFGNVLLTEQEHAGLIEKFGESKTARMIDKLDVEISAKGYKYKSHYHAMFSWVSKAVEEEAMRGNARASPPGTQPFRSLAQMKMDANRAAADEAEILLFGNKMEAQKHAPS